MNKFSLNDIDEDTKSLFSSLLSEMTEEEVREWALSIGIRKHQIEVELTLYLKKWLTSIDLEMAKNLGIPLTSHEPDILVVINNLISLNERMMDVIKIKDCTLSELANQDPGTYARYQLTEKKRLLTNSQANSVYFTNKLKRIAQSGNTEYLRWFTLVETFPELSLIPKFSMNIEKISTKMSF